MTTLPIPERYVNADPVQFPVWAAAHRLDRAAIRLATMAEIADGLSPEQRLRCRQSAKDLQQLSANAYWFVARQQAERSRDRAVTAIYCASVVAVVAVVVLLLSLVR